MIGAAARKPVEWVYSGTWSVLAGLFLVPREPPMLPSASGDPPLIVRPCDGWLTYRKIVFWTLCLLIDVALFVPWAILFAENRTLALWLAFPWFLVLALPDVIAYVAIYLRYDTTWYILSDRSMRLRHGVWTVHETTITFDNIQNVTITQGPIQRLLKFSNLEVHTAGGGGSAGPKGHGGGAAHVGVLEGVENAAHFRELIMERVRASRGAGLGDDRDHDRAHIPSVTWTASHLDALREIAAHAAALRGVV